jgi:hypothetical protein
MATFNDLYQHRLPMLQARAAAALTDLTVSINISEMSDYHFSEFVRCGRLLAKRRAELEAEGRFTGYQNMGSRIY